MCVKWWNEIMSNVCVSSWIGKFKQNAQLQTNPINLIIFVHIYDFVLKDVS